MVQNTFLNVLGGFSQLRGEGNQHFLPHYKHNLVVSNLITFSLCNLSVSRPANPESPNRLLCTRHFTLGWLWLLLTAFCLIKIYHVTFLPGFRLYSQTEFCNPC